MPRRVSENTVVVIGLGRFGAELARTLMTLDREVLAIERDPVEVAKMAPELTLVVEGDATHLETLRSLGVGEVNTAVVAIGSSLEASLLATSNLAELGVEHIWAKAVTPRHKEILVKVGAKHVVFPELEMGNRVAHQMTRNRVSEYIEFANGYAIALVTAPPALIGLTMAEAHLMSTKRVWCVGVQRPGVNDFEGAQATTRIDGGAVLALAGRKPDIEQFTLSQE